MVCANPSNKPATPPGKTAPTSASGVTNRLTTGIATALARLDTTDTCPNSSKVSGTSPTVTAHCARAASASVAPARRVHRTMTEEA